MNRVQININPDILRWAREEAGYSLNEAAAKINITTEKYSLWETDGHNIPLGKLKILTNTYKRQIAVFLLPYTPDKVNIPKDFRNLNNDERKLSKKILSIIRDVEYFRDTAAEIKGYSYWDNKYDWIYSLKNQVNDAATLEVKVREILSISIDEQKEWKTDNQAYNKWRAAVENNLGIYVFQFSFPLNEAHGFSFTDRKPYAIVTNSNHPYTARIFTIFHELAHILNNQSGICLYEKVSQKQREEWDCNTFAGSLLVPYNQLFACENLKDISHFSSLLKVSREVYLRRLHEENYLNDKKFFTLLEDLRTTYRQKAKKGYVKPEVKSKAERGETFFNMIIDAINQNRITYSKASSVLNLNISNFLSNAG